MLTNQKIALSIIIPAYNEEQFIGNTLECTVNFLSSQNLLENTEVLVVAADGTDKTKEIAKEYSKRFRYFSLVEPGPKVGKGRDVKAGIMAAHGKFRIFMDADMSTPLHHINKILEELHGGADVVYGIRNIWSIHEEVFRKISSTTANWMVRILLLPTTKDSQCGFKGFNYEKAALVFEKQTIQRWGFDIELLKIASINKLKTVPIKIDDWKDPKGKHGLVGENALLAMLSTLKELVLIRMRACLRKYN